MVITRLPSLSLSSMVTVGRTEEFNVSTVSKSSMFLLLVILIIVVHLPAPAVACQRNKVTFKLACGPACREDFLVSSTLSAGSKTSSTHQKFLSVLNLLPRRETYAHRGYPPADWHLCFTPRERSMAHKCLFSLLFPAVCPSTSVVLISRSFSTPSNFEF
ncbi:hypothetical protein V1521DRAFT_121379 [Lipomyces starkeyi]